MSVKRRLSWELVAAASLAAGLMVTGTVAAEPESPSPPAATAPSPSGVWQQHKYSFNYMGFTSIYTCDGLEDKLRLLLRLTGAEPGFEVRGSCARGDGRPDRLAAADLKFSSLQPDGTNPVAAGVWRHVELSPQHPFELGRGDCELIEQFRDRVLPMFTVRNIANNVACIPYQEEGSNFSLSFDVYAPVVPPKASKKASQTPGS